MRADLKKYLPGTINALGLLLVITAGVLLNYPYQNFHLHIAQGDHGNNFYVARRVLQGAIPYRDFWWVYGPLMPYYYALCYWLFGVNMHSVLLGYQLLNLLCGITMYSIIRKYFPIYMAFTAAVFFWVNGPHFSHTFNHMGGIFMIILITYFIFSYIQKPKVSYLYYALVSILTLTLIKYNFGLIMFLGSLISVLIIDRLLKIPNSRDKKTFFFVAAFLAPVFVLSIYAWFFRTLPWSVLRQCLPFLDSDFRTTFSHSLTTLLQYFYKLNYTQGIPIFNALLILAAGYFVYLLKTKRLESSFQKRILAGLATLAVLGFLGLHEFLPNGTTYRLLWTEPFRQLGMFLVIFTVLISLAKPIRLYACLFIILLVTGNHLWRYQFLEQHKEFIPLKRGKIYTVNPKSWLKTVSAATNFLQKNLGPGETFLALPSEQLYYFLTDRDSPNRLSELSVEITPQQETEIIESLEKKKVPYILVSNRYRNANMDPFPFGVNYCQRLGHYIVEHYQPCETFGEWDKTAEWVGNHSVSILKRVDNKAPHVLWNW